MGYRIDCLICHKLIFGYSVIYVTASSKDDICQTRRTLCMHGVIHADLESNEGVLWPSNPGRIVSDVLMSSYDQCIVIFGPVICLPMKVFNIIVPQGKTTEKGFCEFNKFSDSLCPFSAYKASLFHTIIRNGQLITFAVLRGIPNCIYH